MMSDSSTPMGLVKTPSPEQLCDWRTSLVEAIVEIEDKQTRFDLSEILKALLPTKN